MFTNTLRQNRRVQDIVYTAYCAAITD